MSANVTLNQSVTTVEGQVPVGYSMVSGFTTPPSPTYTGAVSTVNGTAYDVTGSVLATTTQFNNASGELAGSQAMVTQNSIGLTITGAANTEDVVNGSPAVTGNSMAAAFIGNSATTNLAINAGGAPTFIGSTAVTNIQQNFSNIGTGFDPVSNGAAVLKNSQIGLILNAGSGEASVALAGAVAVTGNAMTASAVGNQAAGTGSTGNVLTLAGGIGLLGTTTGQNSETYFDGGAPRIDLAADAIVNNAQYNSATPLDSIVTNSTVRAMIPIVAGGSVALSSNTITAQTLGNEAYNALLAPGLGSPGTGGPLNGALALGSLQSNQNSAVTATILDSNVPLIVWGPTSNASLAASANTVSASATGNSVVNAVNLNASSFPSYTGTAAGTYAERNSIGGTTNDFGAYADVTLNSQQTNDVLSPVTATNNTSGMLVFPAFEGGGVSGSSVSVTNNAAAALATGNAATNSLALTGASITASAALANAQGSYGSVAATLTDPLTEIVTGVVGALDHPSALALTGNLERAIATGNSASSTLTATGSTMAIANAGVAASVFHYVPSLSVPIASDGTGDNNQTSAGFVAHNDQATAGPVSAVVTFGNAGLATSMGIVAVGGLTSSTADNSTNTVVAAARGNQASTQLTLAPAGSLGIVSEENGVYSPFAVVANVQTLANGATVSASIGSDTAFVAGVTLPPIVTAVGVGLTGSTVTMTGNQIATLAQGNNATNGLTLANAGTVMDPASAAGASGRGLFAPPLSGGGSPQSTLTADAAFVVHNMQVAGTGGVSATQDATGVQAALTGNVLGSTVMIGGTTAPLGNVISAIATTNLASNALTLGAANLSASSGLMNFQVSNGATTTTMGEAGTMPTPASSNVVTALTSSDHNGSFSGATLVDNESYQAYTGWLKTTDPNSLSDGFTQGTTSGNTGNYYKFVTNYHLPENTVGDYGHPVTYNNTVPASPGAWGSPGFVISLNGNVTNSVLGISQNTINAASTANSATNTITSTSAISSGSLTYSGQSLPGSTFNAPLNPGAVVLADVGLLNTQTLGAGGTTSATANGSFWINNVAATPVFTNTTLSISDNTQQANAMGNSATNLLTLSPGVTPLTVPIATTPETASIFSLQTAAAGLTATSNMLISAPLALTGSTLTVAGNTNMANAVANDVTNTLTVTGATSLPGYNPLTQSSFAGANGFSFGATGDYTVVNAQVVTGSGVQSNATTTMVNNDLYRDPAAISGTSVSVDRNMTTALAIGNRASNMLTITAAGPSAATGAVANNQTNGSSIGANATMNVTFGLGQAPGVQTGSTTNNTTYSMTNNTTQAFATGNQASNALNASPTAYGTAVVQSGSRGSQTNATYAVLNAQANNGAVTAAVTGVSPPLLASTITTGQGGYVVALNTTGTGNVVNMSGNTVTSQAIGNRASNNIVLAALNTGTASSAINSVQTNSGAIAARITNTQVGAAVSAGTIGRVANNQLVANAFGNVVTNSISTH